MVKDKILEALYACLYQYKERIKTASGSDLMLIAEATEHITILIMGLEGVNVNEVWETKVK